MFTLTLTPDQPCPWPDIEKLLHKWDSATLRVAEPTQDKASFSTKLPTGELERFSTILELKNILKPHGISFSLEIRP